MLKLNKPAHLWHHTIYKRNYHFNILHTPLWHRSTNRISIWLYYDRGSPTAGAMHTFLVLLIKCTFLWHRSTNEIFIWLYKNRGRQTYWKEEPIKNNVLKLNKPAHLWRHTICKRNCHFNILHTPMIQQNHNFSLFLGFNYCYSFSFVSCTRQIGRYIFATSSNTNIYWYVNCVVAYTERGWEQPLPLVILIFHPLPQLETNGSAEMPCS